MAVEIVTPLAPAKSPGLRRYLGDILLAARVIAAVALIAAAGAWPVAAHHLAAVAILTALTWPVRAVRSGTIANLYLAGMLFALVIVAVQFVLEDVILSGRFPLFRSVWIAPVTEEPLKVLPLVLLLFVRRWPFRYAFGAADLMLCGFALGAGFGFTEDLLRGAATYPSAASPRILGVPLLPDSYNAFIGHGGATAFIALSIGWALWCVRWKKLVALAPIVVLGVSYWMMVDHGFANLSNRTSAGSWPAPLRWVWEADGRGALAPYALVGALLATLIAERIALWRVLRPMPGLPLRAAARLAVAPLRRGVSYDSLRASISRVRRLLLYVFSLRQIGLVALHLKGDRPVDSAAVKPVLMRRVSEVAAVQLAARRA